MLVAAVDTATLLLSCALLEAGPAGVAVMASRAEPARPGAGGGHGTRLPGALTDLLAAVGRTLAEVEGYAVGIGPGSFTGLRIGLATWKGLAFAARRPIAGASSLAAMALAAARSAPPGTLLVPLLDARKGEVYAGFYVPAAEGVAPILPEAALAPAALLERLAGRPGGLDPAGFGEGFEAHAAALAPVLPRLPGGPATPGAAEVGRLAAPRLLGAPFDSARLAALEPHYVRKSEAEVKFPDGLPSRPLRG